MNRQQKDSRELQLLLTVDEVNLILSGIGRLPFNRVYPLVSKIQQQAGQQLHLGPPEGPEFTGAK